MILADTSAWVEYDRATGSTVDERMGTLISVDGPLAVTQPIVMEVVAGARDHRRQEDLARLLGRFPLRRFDADVDFTAAARIYRQCRSVGITPRGLIDCMLVAVGGDTRTRSSLSTSTSTGSAGSWACPSTRPRYAPSSRSRLGR